MRCLPSGSGFQAASTTTRTKGKGMSYEPKDNTGSLFKNDKKETDSHPNAKGSALIDGVEYWVDAWTNRDKNGNPYQSLKFKRKEARAAAPAPARRQAPPADDGDIPF
jgi:hypothetical protein